MFLYWIAAERRYVHRLSDIPKGFESERVDVPTNTEGLMAYLNGIHESYREAESKQFTALVEDTEKLIEQAKAPAPPPPPAPVSDVLRDCEIEEHIHNATPERLTVLASAVCGRIREFAKLYNKEPTV